MGRGPGPIRERITLADYAVRFPEMFNVINNIYIFTGGEHTIEEKYVVIFAETDKMVVPPGSTVNLLGCLEIPDTSGEGSLEVQIFRIMVQGSLIQHSTSTIEMGNISGNYVEGIVVNIGGTVTQNAGGVITIGNIEGNGVTAGGVKGIEITNVFGGVQNELITSGKITIGDISSRGVGIFVNDATMTQNAGGDIVIGDISSRGYGLYFTGITGASITQNADIVIGDVSGKGFGIFVTTNSTMTQNAGGEILIGIVSGVQAYGILVQIGATLDTSGRITIKNVIAGALGIVISDNGTITQNAGGVIVIESVLAISYGIYIENATMTQNANGTIAIGNISLNGIGIFLVNNGIMTQNAGGEIAIGNVSGSGIYISTSNSILDTSGVIFIENVLDGIGLVVYGIMTQNAGESSEIIIFNVSGTNSAGINISDINPKFTVSQSVVVNNVQTGTAGIVSTIAGGMENNGVVDVRGQGVKYSDALPFNSVDPTTSPNFVGTGTYI